MSESTTLLDIIAQAIFDKKGMNILALDVRGFSTMTDYYVIAEGSVDRHLRAISMGIQDALGHKKMKPFHVEGEGDSDWVVLDYGEVVIHLFTPELRERYALEDLWKKSKIIDLKIDISKK